MSKREKIIVGLMIAAILYGGYNFFLAPSSKTVIESPEKKGEVLNQFVTDVAAKLKKKDISEADKYVIARANDNWTNDPFLKTELALQPEPTKDRKEEAAQEVIFRYSGYMEMGAQRLAIINGMEYSVDDELEPGGYIVKSISAAQVVLGVAGTEKTVVIPVQEME